jgi:hypothetical protein
MTAHDSDDYVMVVWKEGRKEGNDKNCESLKNKEDGVGVKKTKMIYTTP